MTLSKHILFLLAAALVATAPQVLAQASPVQAPAPVQEADELDLEEAAPADDADLAARPPLRRDPSAADPAPADPALRPVFDQFGGRDGLVALMDDFMALLVADPRTRDFFAESDQAAIKAHPGGPVLRDPRRWLHLRRPRHEVGARGHGRGPCRLQCAGRRPADRDGQARHSFPRAEPVAGKAGADASRSRRPRGPLTSLSRCSPPRRGSCRRPWPDTTPHRRRRSATRRCSRGSARSPTRRR